ncbi:MAG: hypothetical protein WC455_13315 [Dehalococcoidia bacterium]|jgi:hypothetical protein
MVNPAIEENIIKRAAAIRLNYSDKKLPDGSVILDELCHCGHLMSEHNDDNPYYPGHGQCLRCECKQFTWTEFVTKRSRIAFFVMETRTDNKGEYVALIAVEDESGFHITDWSWGSDFKQAQEIANERNTRLGLSKEDAAKIVCSTMRQIKLPEADTENGET